MPTAPISLILDFLDSLAAGPKPYAEVMEAWRTSCPRLTVWEDAVDEGLVVRRTLEGAGVWSNSPPRAEVGWPTGVTPPADPSPHLSPLRGARATETTANSAPTFQ